MPIYEYRCTQCGHKLETLQKFSDAPLTTCPSCGKEALSKLVSAAGFQLKGSGWYQTDFRGGSKPVEKTDGSSDGAKADAASKGTPDAAAGASSTADTSKASGTASSGGDKGSGSSTPAPSAPASS